jgi:DNA topoisomerase-1
MGKNLVIVESPAKAKTIGRYLGKDFRITASVGHIRDLPSSTLGVDVDHEYKPQYITMKGKEKVIHELVDMASDSDRIYIATDPDREGEAIAWHIAQVLKIDEKSDCRITFNEITEPAVKNAVAHPRPIDMNLVNSQQARRILDRLVGYELSPLLWKKVRKGLSAGRVQSVATRLVVDREKEIQAFKPEEYWLLTAFLHKQLKDPTFKARYHGEYNSGKVEKRRLTNETETNELLTDLAGRPYTVAKVKKGSKQKQPNAPFTTSTLQQEASRYLSFTAKKTMSVAQQLYEGVELPGLGAMALVTYIRTDSVRVSDEAAQEARQYITERFGLDYLPKAPRQFKNRNKAQDAHEAIRPAHFDLSPAQVKDRISNDQFRLYQLIWDKFMASQMAAALVDTVVADIVAGTHLFRVSGETVRFPGFLAQYGLTPG